MERVITLDWETADRITLDTLNNSLEYLIQELKDHRENGQWMHSDDVEMSENVYIPALRTLIKYYGG